MENQINLQGQFLTQMCRGGLNAVLFLMNGFQIRGVITHFDTNAVVVVSDGKQQFIYRHAISTIVPEHPISL